jgi:hypothetical protein
VVLSGPGTDQVQPTLLIDKQFRLFQYSGMIFLRPATTLHLSPVCYGFYVASEAMVCALGLTRNSGASSSRRYFSTATQTVRPIEYSAAARGVTFLALNSTVFTLVTSAHADPRYRTHGGAVPAADSTCAGRGRSGLLRCVRVRAGAIVARTCGRRGWRTRRDGCDVVSGGDDGLRDVDGPGRGGAPI